MTLSLVEAIIAPTAKLGLGLAAVLTLALAPAHFCLQALAADIPTAALKTPPMVTETSVSTYVPSEAAPGQGLAVNLIYSAKPRYKEGAPVLVLVPGGNGSQGLDFSMHAAQQGFVELRFAFPGGGKPGFFSSGIYDNRGIKSQEALRDIMRFAAGEIADHQGKKINELLPIKVDNKSIGAVGWSNGGNTLLVTLGKYIDQLPFLSWVAFYESPVGNMFYPPSLGGCHDMMLNKHYRQGTAATGQVVVDYKKLRYQKGVSKAPGAHKKVDEPELPGVAYFDENNNSAWDESSEFALPYATDIGIEKQIYPPAVTKVLALLPEFQPPKPDPDKKPKKGEKPPPPPPTPFVSYDESIAYFRERDGSQYIKGIIQQRPDLAFTVFGSHLDHLQRQPDHPHIALLYNSLLEHKPKFLRLNPSSQYVAAVTFMKPSTFVENRPSLSIEADTMDQYLEPEGLIPVYTFMEAAAAELADRVHTAKWNKILEAPLVNYSNGAKPPEEPAKTKSSADSKDKTRTKGDESGSASGSSGKDNPGGKDKTAIKGKGSASTTKDKSASSAPGSSTDSKDSSNAKDWPFPKN